MEQNLADAPLVEILEEPTDILRIEPARARKMLERIATEAHVQNPGDWRVPVRAVLDAVFFQKDPGPRQYRTKARLCGCGCGTVVKPDLKPGPVQAYVNHAHRQRALRARKKAAKESM